MQPAALQAWQHSAPHCCCSRSQTTRAAAHPHAAGAHRQAAGSLPRPCGWGPAHLMKSIFDSPPARPPTA